MNREREPEGAGDVPLRTEEIFENVPFKWSDFVLCFEINFAILVENCTKIGRG